MERFNFNNLKWTTEGRTQRSSYFAIGEGEYFVEHIIGSQWYYLHEVDGYGFVTTSTSVSGISRIINNMIKRRLKFKKRD